MEEPLTWDGNDALYAPDTAPDTAHENKPFSYIPPPLCQVLQVELGPGELDAATRACKAWTTQLSQDVVHCEMCLPASFELLPSQLEQAVRRFKDVHSWKLWLPVGRNWTVMEELNLLQLLSRYNAEKLQLDGLLNWNTEDRDLPSLSADVLSWMPPLTSLQTLTVSNCTQADPSGLCYMSFLPNLTSLTFHISAETGRESDWSRNGLASILPSLHQLQQIVEIEIHVEGAEQLPEALAQQVRQVYDGRGTLQRFGILLRHRGGIEILESVVSERVSTQDEQTQSVAAAASQQQHKRVGWLAWMDPTAARAAAAAGLDLSAYLVSETSEARGLQNTAAGSSRLLHGVSHDDSFWLSPSTVYSTSRLGPGHNARDYAFQGQVQWLNSTAVPQAAPDSQRPPCNAAATAAYIAVAPPAAAIVPGGALPGGSPSMQGMAADTSPYGAADVSSQGAAAGAAAAATDDSGSGNSGGAQQDWTDVSSQIEQQTHQLEHLEMVNIPADQMAVAPVPAWALAPAGALLHSLQLNECLVEPDSVLVTHLKLIGLTGPAALYHRLQQQLSGSPAIALQDVEFEFKARYTCMAVEGGGHVWQLLLRQMLLLRGLTVCGVQYCEAADDAPHFWTAIGQLRGLTKLCFDSERAQGDRVPMLDVEDLEPAAAMHELVLDALFMQVLTCRLQGLKTLEFNGEIPNPGAPGYVEYIIKGSAGPHSGLHHSSSGRRVDPRQPPLSYLTLMTNLTSLSLAHTGLQFARLSGNYGAQLDMAWLPAGLTRLKLADIALSCHGQRSVSSAAAAASYMALLLQQRQINTPDAIVVTEAAAAAKGKMPVEALPLGAAATLRLQGAAGSSSNGTTRCIWQQQPPVNLCNLQELKIQGCEGVQAAVIGCLAHSTGLTMLSLSAYGIKPERVSLAAIAWMWPRLQTVDLSTCDTGSNRGVSAAAAAAGEGGLGESGHKLLPDLLDPSVTPELAAAWLWHLDTPLVSGSGSSSSSAAAGVRSRLVADICSRSSSSPSWADPEELAMFASGLVNLRVLGFQLTNYSTCSDTCSDSSPSLRPRHLLGLVHAQRLCKLTVALPLQPEHQAAADIMSLTQLSRLRQLSLRCGIITADGVSMQSEADAADLAAAAAGEEVAAAPLAGAAAATKNLEATASAAALEQATASAAALEQAAAVAVIGDLVAPQPAPPADVAAVEVPPMTPSELMTAMTTNMPNTSVYLNIFKV